MASFSRPSAGASAWSCCAATRPTRPGQPAPDRSGCGRLGQRLSMEFMGLRNDSVTRVRSLGPGDVSKRIEHPKAGRLAVRDLLHEWIHHDRNHTKQLLAIAQERVWPHMGNAQKFKGE